MAGQGGNVGWAANPQRNLGVVALVAGIFERKACLPPVQLPRAFSLCAIAVLCISEADRLLG